MSVSNSDYKKTILGVDEGKSSFGITKRFPNLEIFK
jgi:hypothetical protein